MLRTLVLRSIAALISLFIVSAGPASAHDAFALNPVWDYASILRTINPKLPVEKSLTYASSLLADARRMGLDPRFVMAIVTVESRWRSNAVSRVGARGLGQLMPGTAAKLNVNAWDPAQNLRGTSAYLRSLVDRFRGSHDTYRLAIAGYNAGPNAVKRFGGVPPYRETQHYVVKVLRVWQQLNTRVGAAWSPARTGERRAIARRVVPAAEAATANPDGDFFLAPIPEFQPKM